VGSLDNTVSGVFSSQYFLVMIPLFVGSVAAAVIELALQRVDEHQQCHEKNTGGLGLTFGLGVLVVNSRAGWITS